METTAQRGLRVGLALSLGVTLVAVDAAGAVATTTDEPTCTVSSVESAPDSGPTSVSSRTVHGATSVIGAKRTSARAVRTTDDRWRARVGVRTTLQGSAARTVWVRVPTSVTSIATAQCGSHVAEATASASARPIVSHRFTADAKNRIRLSGESVRDSRKRALWQAQRNALALAGTQHRRLMARELAQRSTTWMVDAAVTQVAADLTIQAQARARSGALAKAKALAEGTTSPSPTPTSTAPVPTTPTPVPSTTAPTPPPSQPPAPTSTPAPTTSAPVPTTSPTASTGPLLIKHGWDVPSPAFVAANVASMEQLPFDGLTVAMPSLGPQVQRQTPVSYEQFKQALAPLAGVRFNRLKHNFVMVYNTPAGDFFGDWSVPIQNFANLARAAKEVGLTGIFYDNEEYFGRSVDWPNGCPNATVEQCQAQVLLRGKQVMEAMRAQWPTVRVMTSYGAWVSEPRTATAFAGKVPYNDVSFANELMGSFNIGLAAGATGTQAKVIDGGEIYTARTASQFSTIRAWQTTGMASSSPLIPASLKPTWASTVSPAFAVFDQPWLGVPMDPSIWSTTIANALSSTEQYVWLYTERHDWWGSGWPSTRVPAEWVDATKRARGLL